MNTLSLKEKSKTSHPHRTPSTSRIMTSPARSVHPINNGTHIQTKCVCGGGCSRCLGVIQPKLTIGQPNDKYEQEADRVADQVMRMPGPTMQRQAEDEEEELVQSATEDCTSPEITPLVRRQPMEEAVEEERLQPRADTIQRQPIEEEAEALQAKAVKVRAETENGEETAQSKTAETRDGISSLKGGGIPITRTDREFFAPRFGRDFSSVRLHQGVRAGDLARQLRARAFAVGADIAFAHGQYTPGSAEGRRLLAHELVHVVQQTGNGAPRQSASGFGTKPGRFLRCKSPLVQRSRALFASTAGSQPYVNLGVIYHRQQGSYPAVQRVGSVEEMLEHMVQMQRPIEWVRILSHGNDQGLMLPLMRGGNSILQQNELHMTRRFELQQSLGSEYRRATPPSGHGTPVMQYNNYHVVPLTWVEYVWRFLYNNSTREHRSLMDGVALQQYPTPRTDMHDFFWWVIDHTLTGMTEPRQRRRRTIQVPIIDLPRRRRRRILAIFQRNVAILRNRVIEGPYAGGLPLDVADLAPPRRGARPMSAEKVQSLETAIIEGAREVVGQRRSDLDDYDFTMPDQSYRSRQGALERGTFMGNLLQVKYMIPNGAEFQLRACNIGQNMFWLHAFRDFFGHGQDQRRTRPHVSAPRLQHVYFGRRRRVQVRGRMRWRYDQVREGMDRRDSRGRVHTIQSNDPEFAENMMHAL